MDEQKVFSFFYGENVGFIIHMVCMGENHWKFISRMLEVKYKCSCMFYRKHFEWIA